MSTREELARQAEKSLRQGRVDEAIAQYQELAYLAPVDWGLVKQLADLLERTGQREGAARQFARWADHLFAEGFHSKAAALYKKVLKLEDNDEHALWQLGEVSLELKLRADARVAFQRVADLRLRRGDPSGAADARARLATLDATPAVPTSTPATPPAYASARAPMVPPAVARDTIARPDTMVRHEAIAPAAAAPVFPAPVFPAPVSAAPASPAVSAPLPEPAQPPVVAPAMQLAATPEARLARLRREAEDADDRQAADADARWLAVLDADPEAVAVRLRLVDAAIEKDDLELASQLAEPLDAAEDPALVVLVDLAHRRGHPGGVDRLIAGRVRAGALPAHVLAPVTRLSVRHPAAARAALVAAVAAWTAAGQPGHAVAAIEQVEGRGLLTTAMYMQWVEICVDAGLPELSRAQRALARAYLAEDRVAEARAVAEDVFVRESGAEPSRTLLLDVLAREGVADPDRILAGLLTPPSDRIAEGDDEEVEEPAVALAWLPDDLDDSTAVAPEPVPEPRVVDALMEEHAPAAAEPAATRSIFDWSDLLGRDVDHWGGPAVAAPIAGLPAVAVPPPAASEPAPTVVALPPPMPAPEAVRIDVSGSVDVRVPEPVAVTPVEDGPTAIDVEALVVAAPPGDALPAFEDLAVVARPDEPAESPARLASSVSAVADEGTGLGDLRAQPILSADAPLQPSFSMPRGWLTEASEPSSADAPRRRAPEDDYFFDDDATPPRWATSALRRPVGSSAPAPAAPTAPAQALPQAPLQAVAPVADRAPAPLADPTPPPAQVAEAYPETASQPASEPESEPLAAGTDLPPNEGTLEATLLAVGVPTAAADSDSGHASPVSFEVLNGPRQTASMVEEEVDLTQLLEELKQWDPVLPEPRARLRPPSTDTALAGLPLDVPAPVPVENAWTAAMPPATSRVADDLAHDDASPESPTAHGAGSAELDAVFADMQQRGDDRAVAEQQLAAGRVFLAAGLASEAARAFERASAEPRSRFEGTLALAELHKSRGQLLEAVTWYEQAATAPVPDAAVKRAVLYDLAESLEALGESDRALGVLLDLVSQVDDYRDARARLDRLLRVDAGG